MMPPHLLDFDDDALVCVLRKAIADDPPFLGDVLLVCKRMRNALLAAATTASITSNNPTLLRHCSSVRTMTLSGCSRLPWAVDDRGGVPRCAPNHLSHLSALTRIDASAAHIWDAELRKLRCLPSLAHLRVSKSMPDGGLAQLAGVTCLRHLDLRGCSRLTAAGLAHLARAPALECLDLRECGVPTNECLPRLTALTALTRLEIEIRKSQEPWGITDDGLACLARLTALRSLNLKGSIAGDAEEFHHLSALCCLEELDLSENCLFDHDVAFLSHLTRLHTLDLESCGDLDFNKGLAHVAHLTRLTELTFTEEYLDNEGMQHLTGLTAITDLNLLVCSDITERGYARLRHLSSLRRITLNSDAPVPLASMLAHLTGLQQLQEVYLDPMDDEALALVCKLSRLRRLELQPGVTEQGLPHLANLSALESLSLEYCSLDVNQVFLHVSWLTNLTRLDLGDPRVPQLTDAGLAHLSTLQKLRWLYFDDCKLLTDCGVASLAGFYGLTSLSLRGARISHLLLPLRLQVVDLHGCAAIGDDALPALGCLQLLAELRLSECTQLSDAGLARLGDLTTLKGLNLCGCKLVTSRGLQRLFRLRALKSIFLSGCVRLDGRAPAALARLRALGYVDLSGCRRIPSESLSDLARLPRLHGLALRDLLLPSEALMHMALISSLKSLDLEGCSLVDRESITRLASLDQLQRLYVSEHMAASARAKLRHGSLQVHSTGEARPTALALA